MAAWRDTSLLRKETRGHAADTAPVGGVPAALPRSPLQALERPPSLRHDARTVPGHADGPKAVTKAVSAMRWT